MSYKLYAIFNKINGHLYVGYSNNLKRRFYEHKKRARRITNKSYAIHHAIRKYGVDNFIFKEIDCASSYEEANEKEIEWIRQFKLNGYLLYNETLGGMGGKGCHRKWTDEQKTAASLRNSGSGNPMYGIKLYGEANGNFGKKMKPHVKEKLLKIRSKLTVDEVKKIRELYSNNASQTSLSKMYNISLTQIHCIVHYKRWKNI